MPRQLVRTEPVSVRYDRGTEVEILGPGRWTIARWCREFGFFAELCLSLGIGLTAGLTAAPVFSWYVVAAVLVFAVAAFHKGRAITSPLPRQLRMVAHSVVVALAFCAMAITSLPVPMPSARATIVAVIAAGAVSALCRTLRWSLQSPVRVLLVGDRLAISEAAARWQRTDRIAVVAALLVEPDLDDPPAEIMGVPTVTGVNVAPALVEKFAADLVVVSPGPGFTHVDFRRLAWELEGTAVNLGVLGVLDSVAPHRITPGLMHGATVHDVRMPRPSLFVRFVKSSFDRSAAALLLLATAPLLLGVALAVRLDSPGRALFTQNRVGRHGKLFKVYKMRTMVENADELKSQLAERNEYDGVLFKMRNDPRVTKVGAFLRRTSLDELPQLINVIRGEMSLVGPRPSLPSEVEQMDADTLRRLAVRPGITGLWQVSGRSDLSWQQASALDTYYADNYSVSGDVSILMRTARAVLRGDGAY